MAVLLEPSLQPGIEQQAVGRICRIGQERPPGGVLGAWAAAFTMWMYNIQLSWVSDSDYRHIFMTRACCEDRHRETWTDFVGL